MNTSNASTVRFAVFAWTELNRYPVANALPGGKLYVSQKVAQKAADKLYPVAVVRPVSL